MRDAISNTSPLLYLYRIEALQWLAELFGDVWVPKAVCEELLLGRQRGFDVPSPEEYSWAQVVTPRHMPSEWLALDLGPGELAAMALAMENPSRIVLLDDLLARRTAQAAGLEVWGTLRILLEFKSQGLISEIAPQMDRLRFSGMWMSEQIYRRVLKLAGEGQE